MKKLIVLFLVIFHIGCQIDESEEFPVVTNDDSFDLIVPEEFSWSTISQDVLLVNIVSEGVKTDALDSTKIELYNGDGDLLDALIIFKGQVGFNFRVPVTTNMLKVKTPAANTELEFSSKIRSINLEISDVSLVNFKRVDTDKDGLFDKFDEDPGDPNLAITIGSKNSNKKSVYSSATNEKPSSYFIFEDLWPSKGDYDFNDFVARTSFSWKRGKDNYITEISGISNMEWNSPGFGFGFELFETKGTCLIYLNDIIAETEGDASRIDSIFNGFKILSGTKDIGSDTREFTLKVKSHSLKDFACVPFLFKADNMGYQIRPIGTPPTQIMQMQMFKSADDDSPNTWDWQSGKKFKYPLKGDKAFYRSKESYPWGIEFLAKGFNSTTESISILKRYPGFKDWAESGGIIEGDWYNHPASK